MVKSAVVFFIFYIVPIYIVRYSVANMNLQHIRIHLMACLNIYNTTQIKTIVIMPFKKFEVYFLINNFLIAAENQVSITKLNLAQLLKNVSRRFQRNFR